MINEYVDEMVWSESESAIFASVKLSHFSGGLWTVAPA